MQWVKPDRAPFWIVYGAGQQVVQIDDHRREQDRGDFETRGPVEPEPHQPVDHDVCDDVDRPAYSEMISGILRLIPSGVRTNRGSTLGIERSQ